MLFISQTQRNNPNDAETETGYALVQRLHGFNEDLMLTESLNERIENENMQVINDLSKELENSASKNDGMQILQFNQQINQDMMQDPISPINSAGEKVQDFNNVNIKGKLNENLNQISFLDVPVDDDIIPANLDKNNEHVILVEGGDVGIQTDQSIDVHA